MTLTNDDGLAERLALVRSHGITRAAGSLHAQFGSAAVPAWYYEQQALGYNYRITDLQAALGVSQLTRLGQYVERRNALADRYEYELAHLPLQLPTVTAGNRSSFHLFVVRVSEAARQTRDQLFDALRNRGIGVNMHYLPVHLQPYYRALGGRPGLCPESEAYAATAMTLPLYPALTDAQQDHVINAVKELL